MISFRGTQRTFRNPSAYQRLCVACKAQPTVNHIGMNIPVKCFPVASEMFRGAEREKDHHHP
jgi:hypothetical protein